MSSGGSVAGGARSVLFAVAALPVGLVLMVVIMMGGGGTVPKPPDCGGTGPTTGKLNPSGIPSQFVSLVVKAGKRCKEFPAPVIAAQIQQESGWNPRAVSSAGAQGLAQFMPGTWRTFGHGSPFDPAAALDAQSQYDCSLAAVLRKWTEQGRVQGNVTKLALGAYNAGLGAVDAAGGIPQNPQTQAYVPKIMNMAHGRFSQAGSGGGVQQVACSKGTGGTNPGAPATGKARTVVSAALAWQGLPYVWGGGNLSGPTGGGFDCSGLVMAAYHRARIDLPRTAAAQYAATKAHSIPGGFHPGKYQPGDLLFYGSPASSIHHVAIALGNGQLVEAPKRGTPVSTRAVYEADFFAATRPLAQGGNPK